MIGLYRPNILLLNSNLKNIFFSQKVNVLLASDLEEAKNQLAQVNVDIIVAVMNKDNLNMSKFLLMAPSNVTIIVIDDLGGTVPATWKDRADVFLRKETAQENLVKICFDLLGQKKIIKKAA